MPELCSFQISLEDSLANTELISEKITITPKHRKYKHFDLSIKTQEKIFDFSKEQKKHRFYPLLGFNITNRIFSTSSKTSSETKELTKKNRSIRFASHSDALYLQAYAEYLNQYYESYLLKTGLTDHILAYRKGNKTNIHHAKSLFDEIIIRKNCVFISLDIKGFFDNINHKRLHHQLTTLINRTTLTEHHYTVWKNITRYAWVDKEELYAKLEHEYRKQDHDITIKDIKRLFRENPRICTQKEFQSYVRGKRNNLIKKNTEKGIPQGTPISGLYANIYLRSFDLSVMDFCKKLNGSYRRYSDDIALLFPYNTSIENIISHIENLLSDESLSISSNKTETASFRHGKIQKSFPRSSIQYLGFTFDGETILIRPSSQHTYLKKMRRGIHAKMVALKMKKKRDYTKIMLGNEVFKREALSRYTHLGKRRNFLKYVYKASQIMESPAIKKQFKNHMTWFNRAWIKERKKYFQAK